MLQFPHRPRLPDIEYAEQSESGNKALHRVRAYSQERYPLSQHFIHDDESGVFFSGSNRADRGGPRGRYQEQKHRTKEKLPGSAQPVVHRRGYQHRGNRPNCTRSDREPAATEPGGKRQSDALHRVGPSGVRLSSASSSSVFTFPGMTYLSDAQFPKSSSRQRSLQKGMFGSVASTALPQIGQRNVAARPILLSEAG